MSKRLVWMIVSACLFGGYAGAQSLGDVAKRERERREKNKSEGVGVKEFTEEEIFGPADDASEEGDTDAGAEAPPVDVSLEEEAANEIAPAVPSDDVSPEALDRKRADRQRSEAEWRAGVQQARTRIVRARDRKQQLDELHLAEGEYFIDTEGNVVVRSRAHLQELVAEATRDLQDAEAALADLLEDARRAGVPPGWLR